MAQARTKPNPIVRDRMHMVNVRGLKLAVNSSNGIDLHFYIGPHVHLDYSSDTSMSAKDDMFRAITAARYELADDD